MKPSNRCLLQALASAVASLGCDFSKATVPSSAPARAVQPPGIGEAHALNVSPILRIKSTPVMSPGNPYPVIRGTAPLTVTLNLCQSDDADPGDSLNWQFHFGDDFTQPFRADGTFHANFDQFCRTDHTYSAGNFVATVTVTDKHLEDQSSSVIPFARQTERIAIQVFPAPGPEPTNTSKTSRPIDW